MFEWGGVLGDMLIMRIGNEFVVWLKCFEFVFGEDGFVLMWSYICCLLKVVFLVVLCFVFEFLKFVWDRGEFCSCEIFFDCGVFFWVEEFFEFDSMWEFVLIVFWGFGCRLKERFLCFLIFVSW